MSGWWAGCGSRIFAHRRRPPARPAHLACVCSTQRHCVVSLQQIYSVYTADIWIVNTAECQIWRKIMKNELNQVQVAPFGLIFDRGESYRV